MENVFNKRTPAILVVDDFYVKPELVVEVANGSSFQADPKHFKGVRSDRHLLPYVKEEFERLLGVRITDWLDQPMNGVFQKTCADDHLVFHSDSQRFAAAIYLSTVGSTEYGTSFWMHTETGFNRPPISQELCNEVYSEYNLTHSDNWTLVDKVGFVYNRLVIWDAKLIHSASMYPPDLNDRLVQLFFFNAEDL